MLYCFDNSHYDSSLFDDFHELSLEKEEIDILRNLRRLSVATGYEYGQVINANGVCSEPFTSRMENRVGAPRDLYVLPPVKLYHSHTNDTLLSAEDFSLLLLPHIEKVSVITINGLVFSVSVNGGFVPDQDEFDDFVASVRFEIDIQLAQSPSYESWPTVKRQYESIREQAYRIATNFKWRLEGGAL